jgi:hypothetical protein
VILSGVGAAGSPTSASSGEHTKGIDINRSGVDGGSLYGTDKHPRL